MPVIQDIRQMHRDGSSIAEISRKTNASEPTVRKYVRMGDLSPKVPAKKTGALDAGRLRSPDRQVARGGSQELA